eukprot:TRINITY_DN6959_c0_g1_i1.p2 TRINITY_DN6959_c0_g1~~TRINITY_DN6959_c0_g1_i1.p2  ORF type:complete len:113 (-),score=18.15 TRINITY_DN6959_c0_g1_i1:26-364(-)
MARFRLVLALSLAAPFYASSVEVALESGSALDLDDACGIGEDCSLGLRQLRGALKELGKDSQDDECLADGQLGCKSSRDCCGGLVCYLGSTRCGEDYSLAQLGDDSQELGGA